MYRCALVFLIVVAAGTPAMSSFWQQALRGTPMPEAIADLVQKGIDDAPRVVRYPAFPSISLCGAWTGMCTASLAAPTGIFFYEAQLRPGSTMTMSFPAEAEPPILPHDLAEKVPFANLSAVLTTFNIPTGSAQASHVAKTLSLCQSPPHVGELRVCTTSLESAVRSAMNMLIGRSTGGDHGMWMATSVLPAGGGLPRQLYEVQAVTKLHGDYFVGCHKMPFPYRVYQCHMTAGLTDKGYVVSLRGLVGGGPTAKLLAFCHFDTSKWNPAHPAFEVLRTHPGTPVCHFMPYANPVFGIGKKATKPY
ncbi:hypothetical protein VPH35_108144 [Triticum aestivum]|uniref:BURP domain-containing protein n=1 Tax=Triticum aestivum TaxID=4565 RepID=A0A3B6PDR1_WHEAT